MGVFVNPARIKTLANRLDHAVHHARKGRSCRRQPWRGSRPARPKAGAWRRYRRRRGHSYLSRGPQCPWSVYSQKHKSVITSSSGATRRAIRIASCTIPSSLRRRRAARVFVFRDSEKQDRRHAQLGRLGEGLADPVERELVLSRHRWDLTPQVLAMIDKQRIDQVARRQDASRRQVRAVEDGRGAVVADEWDSRTRAGKSWRDSPWWNAVTNVRGGHRQTIVACRAGHGSHRVGRGMRRSFARVNARACDDARPVRESSGPRCCWRQNTRSSDVRLAHWARN